MNWKLFIEGFLEAYHLRVTHRKTFARVVFDNLALHDAYGPHSRTIYPLRKVEQFAGTDLTECTARPSLSFIYHVFPNSILAVEPHHVAMLTAVPLDVATTRIRHVALATPEKLHRPDLLDQDVALLKAGLLEDYAIAESIQAGLASDANQHFTFGLFEGMLTHFHRALADTL